MGQAAPKVILREYVWLDATVPTSKVVSSTHLEPKSVPANSLPAPKTVTHAFNNEKARDGTNTVLHPVVLMPHPIHKKGELVFCEVYETCIEDNQIVTDAHWTNERFILSSVLKRAASSAKPLFSFVQHYLILNATSETQQTIAKEHAVACGEELVAYGQSSEDPERWHFKTDKQDPLLAADALIISRFLLQQIAERHNAEISYAPTPGNRLEVHFSVAETRAEIEHEDAFEWTLAILEKLHDAHHCLLDPSMGYYGYGAKDRSDCILSSTSDSIVDGRPWANADPYLVIRLILELTMPELESTLPNSKDR